MNEQSVCAIIVTYHPTAAMLENMAKILAQVQRLVVVDNGSTTEELVRLRNASQTLGFCLIENGENLGIAEALNRGVHWAQSQGFRWVILFDQDSRITDGFVEEMFEACRSHPEHERVASIHPSYVEPETGIEPVVQRAGDGGPITSMTSGALMPTWIFEKIGYFASEYFIDLVDCEYCFRIRAAGYLVADSRKAVLLHTAGNPKRISFLGFSFQPSHHSVMRRYYISRNRVVVYRKFFRIFPRWIMQSIYQSFRETIKCLIAERERGRKLRCILLGTWDGLIGRMGKREGL